MMTTRDQLHMILAWRALAAKIARKGVGNARNRWKRGGTTIHSGSQLIKPIDPKYITAETREQMKGKRFLTRNSSCPCNSGRRYKRCCMVKGAKP